MQLRVVYGITKPVVAAMIAAILSGCIVISRNPPYPRDWAPPSSERIQDCRFISGTFENVGVMHIESGKACDEHQQQSSAGWNCSTSLTDNLGINVTTPVRAVSLSQPDAETLAVGLLEHSGREAQVLYLRRGTEYQCDDDALSFSKTRSLLGGPALTAAGMLFLIGGAEHYSRTFNRTTDGELVMTVHERIFAWEMVFGAGGSVTSYVRWRPVPLPEPQE